MRTKLGSGQSNPLQKSLSLEGNSREHLVEGRDEADLASCSLRSVKSICGGDGHIC